MLWEVSHGGMTRYFKHDWQANWHYESAVRLYGVKADRKAQLIPAGQLGVKLTDPGARLRQELLLMPALPDEAGAQLLQRFLVSAGVNLPNAAFNLQLLFKALVNDHPVSPAHRLEDSYQVMPQKASLSSGCCNGLSRDSCAAVGSSVKHHLPHLQPWV